MIVPIIPPLGFLPFPKKIIGIKKIQKAKY